MLRITTYTRARARVTPIYGDGFRRFRVEYAAPEQEARYEADPWEELISAWLEARPGLRDVTVPQVADAALQLTPRDLGTATQRRIAACLERLGWERGGRKHGGRRVWVPAGAAL